MKIKATETITIGEKTFVVSTLPDTIKGLVEFYDDVRKDQEKARIEYSKCQSALRDISNQIIAEVNKFEAEAAEKTVAEDDDDV